MRPLVVLILVLGALAALLFALTSVTDTRGDEDHGLVPVPQRATEESPDMRASQPLAEPAEATRVVAEDARQAVEPDLRAVGARVAFGAIEGVVITKDGTPVEGAKVGLLNVKPSSLGDDIYALRGVDPPKPVAKAETGPDGTFEFRQLDPRKDWCLSVTHPKYVSYKTEMAIPVPEGGSWQETVTLESGLESRGVVRDAKTNLPIEGVLLVVDGPFARMGATKSPTRMEATTDKDGVFTFTNVGANAQARVLTISAPGYATQVHPNFIMAAMADAPTRVKNVRGRARLEAQDHDFALEPGTVLAGRVVDPEQRGVAGVEVEAISQSGALISQGVARSGAKGEFLIEGLAEGIYTLRVTAANFDAHALQRVESGKTDILIELFELGSVVGKVVDPRGNGLTNFTVKARANFEGNKGYGSVVAQRNVKGARDGAFELKGLPEGEYVIEGIADGYASSFSEVFTATQGLATGDVVVRMSQGGSISGVVLDRYSGDPIAGAEISTLDNDYMDGALWELFGAVEDPSATTKVKVFTGQDGTFEVKRMTPGTYQVQVKARGYSAYSVKDIVVVEGQNTEVPSHLLIKGAVIRGVVYGPEKQIQAGARVQISPSDQSFDGQQDVRSDGAGRFAIENVRPGTYDLSATRPNSGSGNPFEAIGDMQTSKIQVTVEDGKQYEFDLHITSIRDK